jgi:hypothetical protein
MKRSVEVVYTEYWVIRVVKDLDTRKAVTKEVEFATPPTEQDIVDVLIHCEPNEFVSVEHNYRLGK